MSRVRWIAVTLPCACVLSSFLSYRFGLCAAVLDLLWLSDLCVVQTTPTALLGRETSYWRCGFRGVQTSLLSESGATPSYWPMELVLRRGLSSVFLLLDSFPDTTLLQRFRCVMSGTLPTWIVCHHAPSGVFRQLRSRLRRGGYAVISDGDIALRTRMSKNESVRATVIGAEIFIIPGPADSSSFSAQLMQDEIAFFSLDGSLLDRWVTVPRFSLGSERDDWMKYVDLDDRALIATSDGTSGGDFAPSPVDTPLDLDDFPAHTYDEPL